MTKASGLESDYMIVYMSTSNNYSSVETYPKHRHCQKKDHKKKEIKKNRKKS